MGTIASYQKDHYSYGDILRVQALKVGDTQSTESSQTVKVIRSIVVGIKHGAVSIGCHAHDLKTHNPAKKKIEGVEYCDDEMMEISGGSTTGGADSGAEGAAVAANDVPDYSVLFPDHVLSLSGCVEKFLDVTFLVGKWHNRSVYVSTHDAPRSVLDRFLRYWNQRLCVKTNTRWMEVKFCNVSPAAKALRDKIAALLWRRRRADVLGQRSYPAAASSADSGSNLDVTMQLHNHMSSADATLPLKPNLARDMVGDFLASFGPAELERSRERAAALLNHPTTLTYVAPEIQQLAAELEQQRGELTPAEGLLLREKTCNTITLLGVIKPDPLEDKLTFIVHGYSEKIPGSNGMCVKEIRELLPVAPGTSQPKQLEELCLGPSPMAASSVGAAGGGGATTTSSAGGSGSGNPAQQPQRDGTSWRLDETAWELMYRDSDKEDLKLPLCRTGSKNFCFKWKESRVERETRRQRNKQEKGEKAVNNMLAQAFHHHHQQAQAAAAQAAQAQAALGRAFSSHGHPHHPHYPAAHHHAHVPVPVIESYYHHRYLEP